MCKHCQMLVLVARDSSEKTVLRCTKLGCTHFGQDVTSEQCDACPEKEVEPVKEAQKPEPVKPPEPKVTYGETQVMGANGVWTCPECGFTYRGRGSHFHRCRRKPEPKKPPTLIQQVSTYAQAMTRWSLAGWPKRTREEVSACIDTCIHCPAGLYDAARQRCNECGCRANRDNWAILNKAKMATETCPKGFWPLSQWELLNLQRQQAAV